jgi:hypothetical protein
MGQNVVRLPIISINGSAADVATTACLAEHLAAICFCEHRARGALATACNNSASALRVQVPQSHGKRADIREHLFCLHLPISLWR